MRTKIFSVLVLIILCIPVIQPLFINGYFPMHDDTQVARVVTMGRALRNAQFPVRWVSDLGYGYGYPIFNFYGPLPYYIGGFFYALGVSGLISTKLMMAIGMILPGITMFIIARRIAGNTIGIISAITYVYMPYHAVQLYVRGAVGEMWVLIFLPLIIGSMYSAFYEGKNSLSIVLGTFGIAGTILSHTILGFTTTFFCLLIVALLGIGIWLRKFSAKQIAVAIISILSGLSLSAFFWIPAISEMNYTTVSRQIGPTAQIKDHFVCIQQFFFSPWGFGGSTIGCADGMSFALGKIHIALIVLGTLGMLLSLRKKQGRLVGILGVGIVASSVFFMTDSSIFLWNILPGFSYVQYPWRFLVYTALGISLLTIAFFVHVRNSILIKGFAVIFVVAVIALNAKVFQPQYTYFRNSQSFETDEDIKFRASRISDEYLPPDIKRPNDSNSVIDNVVPLNPVYSYKNIIDKESYKKIEFISKLQTEVLLRHAYFPGWKYWVNSVPQDLRIKDGQPFVTLPVGFSTLEMKFANTIPRTIGNVISLISVVVLVYYYGKKTIS